VNITVAPLVEGSLAEAAWGLYIDVFADLAAAAVQRHVMYHGEFVEVMGDKRVDKYLAHDDGGKLVGLATFTNDLDAVPLISPAYFQRHWPDLYAQGRIWYIGFVAVSRTGRAMNALAGLVEAMYAAVTSSGGGLVGLDVCRYNSEVRHVAQGVGWLVRRLDAGVRVERADEQSYWLYEFPGVR